MTKLCFSVSCFDSRRLSWAHLSPATDPSNHIRSTLMLIISPRRLCTWQLTGVHMIGWSYATRQPKWITGLEEHNFISEVEHVFHQFVYLFEAQSLCSVLRLIFQQYSKHWTRNQRCKHSRVVEWPSQIPDQHPIGNLWKSFKIAVQRSSPYGMTQLGLFVRNDNGRVVTGRSREA